MPEHRDFVDGLAGLPVGRVVRRRGDEAGDGMIAGEVVAEDFVTDSAGSRFRRLLAFYHDAPCSPCASTVRTVGVDLKNYRISYYCFSDSVHVGRRKGEEDREGLSGE